MAGSVHLAEMMRRRRSTEERLLEFQSRFVLVPPLTWLMDPFLTEFRKEEGAKKREGVGGGGRRRRPLIGYTGGVGAGL